MRMPSVLLALVVCGVLLVGAGQAQALPITIYIPQVSGGFAHGTDYVYGINGIALAPGETFLWATLKLVDFRNWQAEPNNVELGFVRSWGGSTGWSTRSSMPPNTDKFWKLENLTAAPLDYGPQSIPNANLPFLGSKFGIYVDPECHYYGKLELTYEIGRESVPDPGSTLLLFGMGLVGLRAWRKRRE